jgi:hypothetical protein
MDNDKDQLNLLSVFHYVVGGLAALFACIPIIHFMVGLAMATGWIGANEPDAAALAVVGGFLMALAGLFILAGWTFAVCLILAGRSLANRRRYTFCLVMAAIACVFMPFGTILGVFTIIVLMRPSVKELFA